MHVTTRRPPAAWRDLHLTITSVRTGIACEAVVVGAVEGLLNVTVGVDLAAFPDVFRPGDALRVGWNEDDGWQQGSALCARTEEIAGTSTLALTTPEPLDEHQTRRATRRAEYFAACQLLTFADGKPTTVNGRVVDLSAGGMSVRANGTIDGDQPVVFSIALPAGRVVGIARVARLSDRYVHFAFEQTRPTDRRRIAEAIAARLQQP
jgi:hypothetical protein